MPKKINPEEVKKDIRKLVAQIAEVSEDKLKDNARFVEDLGVDSMMALEIVASVEKKFKIVVPEEKIPTMRSLVDVYKLTLELLEK